MANRTLSDLPVVTTVAGADIIHTRQSTTDKSVSESKIAEYVQNLSDYAPTVVAVTGTTHTISTTIRKQLIICTIGSNCTMTFPGTYGNAKEITIKNVAASTANVIGLPNSEVLYPGSEITFIWNGSAWIKRLFTTNFLTGTATPTITPSFEGQLFIDYSNNNFFFAVGTSSSADWLPLASSTQPILTVDADYTIPDSLPSGTKILVQCNTVSQYGVITITLPTLADNIGKWFDIEHEATNEGLVIVDGEGAETLRYKGTQITQNPIYSKGDTFRYEDNGTDWKISGSTKMVIGWQNRSDWTNVHIGNGVTYDNKSAAVDWTGMSFSDGTNTATVAYDSGGTGAAGTLYFYNISGGTGVFTDGATLTAANSDTADVDETGGGTSKNIDYNLYHGFGVNIKNIEKTITLSTDGTENNSFDILFSPTSATTTGLTFFQIDINSFQTQLGTGGINYTDTSGIGQTIDTEDWYCNVSVKF